MDLIQGNSLEWLKETEKSYDFMFTSPPYNRKRNDKYTFYNDDVDYEQLLSTVIDNGMRIADYVFLNIQKNYYNKQDVFQMIGKYSFNIIDIIIWEKSNPMPASGNHITNSYEFVLILSNKHKAISATHTYTKNVYTTPVYSNNPYKKVHRAVMSDVFAKQIMTDYMQSGQSVIDPFMGVGTTGAIAEELGLDFTGIELSNDYFKLAQERLQEVTNGLSCKEG